ncbi:Tartrate-resistant acid phosphatase type 5, partial [Globisporangium splendens]
MSEYAKRPARSLVSSPRPLDRQKEASVSNSLPSLYTSQKPELDKVSSSTAMLGTKSLVSALLLGVATLASADMLRQVDTATAPVAFSEPRQSSILSASPTPAPTENSNLNTLAEVEEALLEYAAAAQLKNLAATTSSNPSQQQGNPDQQGPSRPAKRCSLEIPNDHLVKLRCDSGHIRFIGLGDWGETTESLGVLAVRDGVLRDAKTGNYDFILSAGDNFYDNGVQNVTDSLWKTTWFDRFRIGTELTLPWISFLGNHDHYGKIDAQIEYGLSGGPGSKYWIMPSKYYSVDARVNTGEKLKFVIADTMTLNWTNDAPWVTHEFNDPTARFVISAGHHHIYSAGGRGDNTDPSMVAYNQLIQSTPQVKAHFGGHEHDMQYMRAGGKDYFMFGGGGRNIKEGEVRPGTKADVIFYAKKYGYALYDVDVVNKTMAVTYHVFNSTGQEIDEITFVRRY